MIYGLYLSATGVLTNSYRQDVIANNLANSETVGFKRDMALFEERLTAAQESRKPGEWSDPILEKLGGGLLASPTWVDTTQGEFEPTGNNLDVAIEGRGFFSVEDRGKQKLTRDGRFAVDRTGQLILGNGTGQRVLDIKGKPILLDPRQAISIGKDGTITQNGQAISQIALVDVPDRSQLKKQGDTLLEYPDTKQIKPARGATLRSESIERANVDPATELAALMQAQREMEANANMIRYQDQTLQRLCNDVGKIG